MDRDLQLIISGIYDMKQTFEMQLLEQRRQLLLHEIQDRLKRLNDLLVIIKPENLKNIS